MKAVIKEKGGKKDIEMERKHLQIAAKIAELEKRPRKDVLRDIVKLRIERAFLYGKQKNFKGGCASLRFELSRCSEEELGEREDREHEEISVLEMIVFASEDFFETAVGGSLKGIRECLLLFSKLIEVADPLDILSDQEFGKLYNYRGHIFECLEEYNEAIKDYTISLTYDKTKFSLMQRMKCRKIVFENCRDKPSMKEQFMKNLIDDTLKMIDLEDFSFDLSSHYRKLSELYFDLGMKELSYFYGKRGNKKKFKTTFSSNKYCSTLLEGVQERIGGEKGRKRFWKELVCANIALDRITNTTTAEAYLFELMLTYSEKNPVYLDILKKVYLESKLCCISEKILKTRLNIIIEEGLLRGGKSCCWKNIKTKDGTTSETITFPYYIFPIELQPSIPPDATFVDETVPCLSHLKIPFIGLQYNSHGNNYIKENSVNGDNNNNNNILGVEKVVSDGMFMIYFALFGLPIENEKVSRYLILLAEFFEKMLLLDHLYCLCKMLESFPSSLIDDCFFRCVKYYQQRDDSHNNNNNDSMMDMSSSSSSSSEEEEEEEEEEEDQQKQKQERKKKKKKPILKFKSCIMSKLFGLLQERDIDKIDHKMKRRLEKAGYLGKLLVFKPQETIHHQIFNNNNNNQYYYYQKINNSKKFPKNFVQLFDLKKRELLKIWKKKDMDTNNKTKFTLHSAQETNSKKFGVHLELGILNSNFLYRWSRKERRHGNLAQDTHLEIMDVSSLGVEYIRNMIYGGRDGKSQRFLLEKMSLRLLVDLMIHMCMYEEYPLKPDIMCEIDKKFRDIAASPGGESSVVLSLLENGDLISDLPKPVIRLIGDRVARIIGTIYRRGNRIRRRRVKVKDEDDDYESKNEKDEEEVELEHKRSNVYRVIAVSVSNRDLVKNYQEVVGENEKLKMEVKGFETLKRKRRDEDDNDNEEDDRDTKRSKIE